MNLKVSVLFGLCLCASLAKSQSLPSHRGAHQFNYRTQDIISLPIGEYVASTLVFPAWEQIDKVWVGDKPSFHITQPTSHTLTVQATQLRDVRTSLSVFGASGYVYVFYLKANSDDSSELPYLRVDVLAKKPNAFPKAEEKDYLSPVPKDMRRINFNFSMSGDKSIAPDRVYSDGLRTWFDYGSNIDYRALPAIYAVIDGIDTPINVVRQGRYLVAHANGIFTLKSGEKVTCVYPSAS